MQNISNRLFFCYAWEDLGEIQKVANTIKHELCVDLEPYKGEEQVGSIEENVCPLIDQADVMLVFITEISKTSEYVKQCVVYAQNLNKRIIPILIGKNSLFGSMPEEFRFRSKPVDYKDENQRSKFFGLLKATLGVQVEGGDTFGTLVHISVDVDVKVLRYDKELCIAQRGTDNTIRLNKGLHKLDFINVGNASEACSVTYEVKNNEGEQFLVLNFKKEIIKQEKKRQKEQKQEESGSILLKVLASIGIIAIVGFGLYLYNAPGSKNNDIILPSGQDSHPAVVESIEMEPEISEDDVIKAFITEMYNESKYYDSAFLKEHCTQRLLNKLMDAYDYDTEGEAYASWLFRTNAQDSKYDYDESEKNLNEIISVQPQGDGWYLYEFYDGGWLGRNQIHATVKNDVVWIDDLQNVYSEVDDYVKEQAEAFIEKNRMFHKAEGKHLLQGTISIPAESDGYLCEQVTLTFIQSDNLITECIYNNTGSWNEKKDETIELSGVWLDNGYRFYNDEVIIDLSIDESGFSGHIRREGHSYEINLQPNKDIAFETVAVEEEEYLVLEGEIGPYPITMYLTRNSEKGYYNYHKGTKTNFELRRVTDLSGDEDNDEEQRVVLKEYTPSGNNTGTFEGTFNYKLGDYTGTFTNSKGTSYEFRLNVQR